MREIPVFFIDAFTDTLFKGNPAAVCVFDEKLTYEQMQGIAKEIGFSETCFVMAMQLGDRIEPLQSDSCEDYTLQWFTPETEVNLCGHGTLATAFVLWHLYENTHSTINFHTKSGILPVYKEDDFIVLDFPLLPMVKSERIFPDLFESLGLSEFGDRRSPLQNSSGNLRFPILYESEISRYLLIEITKEQLHNINIDFYRLQKIPIHPFTSIIITSHGDDDYDFYSRCFAVWEGIDEDPVTGSAHCVLASYWQSRYHEKSEFKAYQASARGGEIIINIKGDRVFLKGKATLFMKGKIFLENA